MRRKQKPDAEVKPEKKKTVRVWVRVPMDYPLPQRNWQSDDAGRTWYSTAWTPRTLEAARLSHFKVTQRDVPESLLPYIKQV